MSKSKSSGRGDLDHLELIPYRPHHSGFVQLPLMLWRWAIELILAFLVIRLVVIIQDVTEWSESTCWLTALGVLAWLAGLFYVIPLTRNLVPGLFWCLVTRHRLRAFFIQARVYNRDQRLPWILFVRPTVVGERVWVWLVPGLSVENFTGSIEQLTAATWARTVRVERSRKIGALIRVDIVRRDPLAAVDKLPSVLIPASRRGEGQKVPAAPEGRLDIPRTPVDLTTPVVEGGTVAGKKNGVNKTLTPKRKAALSSQDGAVIPSTPQVISRGGEDVSDYV